MIAHGALPYIEYLVFAGISLHPLNETERADPIVPKQSMELLPLAERRLYGLLE